MAKKGALGIVAVAAAIVVGVGCGGGGHGFGDGTSDAGAGPGDPGQGDLDANLTPGEGGSGQVAGTCAEAIKQKGYSGCDFVFGPPPVIMEATRPPCFAALVANNSSAPAKLTVEYAGKPYDVTTFAHVPNGNPDPTTWPALPATGIAPKGVAVLYLSHDPTSKHIYAGTPLACPGATAVQEPDGASPPWPQRAKISFHVRADHPVTMYDVAPFGGAKSFFPSAEILLPTTTWGTNYVVATPPLAVPPSPNDAPAESEWMRVLAKDDGTEVTIQGATDLEAPSLAEAVQSGGTTKVQLAAGEYVQWFSWRLPASTSSISGTIVSSNKPVAVFGGDTAQRVATTDSVKAVPIKGQDMTPRYCCVDSAHQQIQPINVLGFEYVGAPYATRRADLGDESVLYRIVGIVDGTQLTFDPPVANAPTALAKGQVANVEVKGAVRVASQGKTHPFYFSQNMSYSTMGATRRDGDATWPVSPSETGLRETGDPEWVGLLPPAQFIKEYAFVTDPTYAVTTLVVTRVKESGAFKDVGVDCVGNVTGWKPVGTSGRYEYALVDLVRGGKGVGSCTNGAHTATSDAPFGITVWGVDWWASYAYPAGGAAFQINDVIVNPN